jgi:ubiquinone/menaquinone biosynthesis C-methylase UbiE
VKLIFILHKHAREVPHTGRGMEFFVPASFAEPLENFNVSFGMRLTLTLVFILFCGCCLSQDAWKNIYSQPAWAERDKWQRADDLIRLLNLRPGAVVADVGCHEGYMTFKLAKKVGNDGLVYAVDVSASKLEKVKARANENKITQIKTLQGDDNNPKLPDDVLDAVLILDTYHEMNAHEEILQHLRKSLKRGGRLVICEPIADTRRKVSRVEQEKKHELSIDHALKDLRDAGFKIDYQKDPFIDRTKEKGDKMWVVVAEKI